MTSAPQDGPAGRGAPATDPPGGSRTGPGWRLEYPGLDTRYLVQEPGVGGPDGGEAYTVLATRLDARGDGVSINGQPVPWYLARVPIQVDDPDDGSPRVAYLPVLIDGPVVAGPGVIEQRLGELLAGAPDPYDPEGPEGADGPPSER